MDFHRTPLSMARVLVQYMGSSKKVRSEILSHFGSAPTLSEISRMRGIYDRSEPRRSIRDFDRSVIWMDERHERNMAEASLRLLEAIETARAA